jgi:hypothetical protein
MTDDRESVQEFLPRDADESSASEKEAGKEVAVGAQGPWARFVEGMRGTTHGLRKQKQKVDAQNDLIRSYREAEKELHALMQTAKHLEQQEVIVQGEFEAKLRDHRLRDMEQTRDMQRLEREIKEEENKKALLDLEQTLAHLKLRHDIAAKEKEIAELQGNTKDTQPAVDPHVEQARTVLTQYMDRHKNLGGDKKKWFAQIDEDLANGTISEDEAEERKEDIEQIIRDNTLSP